MVENEINILSTRLANLHEDVSEIKGAMKTLSEAITKLALVEERQITTAVSLERAFTAIEKIETKVSSLEKNVAYYNKTSIWVDRAVTALAGASLVMIAKGSGLM